MEIAEFDILVLSRKDKIFRLAKGMLCDICEAEDATQDILEKLWTKRSSFNVYENPDAVIYTTTRNHCIDRLRKRKITSQRVVEIGYGKEGAVEGISKIEFSNTKAIVEKLMAELPEKQHMVIHLRDIEGYEFHEISAIAQMDEPTVRVTLSRARKTVREKLITIMNYGT